MKNWSCPSPITITYKPDLLPMKAVIFEVIFSLEARTNGSENKGVILKIWPPYFCELLEEKNRFKEGLQGHYMYSSGRVRAQRRHVGLSRSLNK
jgi:hypothetical protein